ncbi:hypothetical protein Hanom_Chr15g01396851 [Helianthus anomalus]
MWVFLQVVFRGRIEFGHNVCCLLGLSFVLVVEMVVGMVVGGGWRKVERERRWW